MPLVTGRVAAAERDARSPALSVSGLIKMAAAARRVADSLFCVNGIVVLLMQLGGKVLHAEAGEHGPCAIPAAVATATRQSARASAANLALSRPSPALAAAVSDLCVLALSLDLLAGLSNPFADHKLRLRVYTVTMTVRSPLRTGARLPTCLPASLPPCLPAYLPLRSRVLPDHVADLCAAGQHRGGGIARVWPGRVRHLLEEAFVRHAPLARELR